MSVSTYNHLKITNFRKKKDKDVLCSFLKDVYYSYSSGGCKNRIFFIFFKVCSNFSILTKDLKTFLNRKKKSYPYTTDILIYFNYSCALKLFRRFKKIRNIKKNRYKLLNKKNNILIRKLNVL